MADMTVARTIATQLGKGALFMLGAKNLCAGENFLKFRIGANPRKITTIVIALNASDLYDLAYYRIRNATCTMVAESHDVYCDQLHADIEAATGLYTHL